MARGEFMLQLDVESIIRKYYSAETSTPNDIEIYDLKLDSQDHCIYFADPHNFPIKYWTTMNDRNSNKQIPNYTNHHCWWDRNSFGTHPLGLPISYQNDVFETEGVFCSFSCMKSYLCQHHKNPLFKNSSSLLLLLYKKMFDKSIKRIPLSPDWRMLKDYGGVLSIDEFRRLIGKTSFVDDGNKVRMTSVQSCFKEIDIN